MPVRWDLGRTQFEGACRFTSSTETGCLGISATPDGARAVRPASRNCGRDDRRVLIQDHFCFCRVDVQSAADDDVAWRKWKFITPLRSMEHRSVWSQPSSSVQSAASPSLSK